MNKILTTLIFISISSSVFSQNVALLFNGIKFDHYSIGESNLLSLVKSDNTYYLPEIDVRINDDKFNVELGYEKHIITNLLTGLPGGSYINKIIINNVVLSVGVVLWKNAMFRLNANINVNLNVGQNILQVYEINIFTFESTDYNIPSFSSGTYFTAEYYIHHAFFFDLLLGVNRYNIQNDFFHHEGLDEQLFIYTAALRVGYEF